MKARARTLSDISRRGRARSSIHHQATRWCSSARARGIVVNSSASITAATRWYNRSRDSANGTERSAPVFRPFIIQKRESAPRARASLVLSVNLSLSLSPLRAGCYLFRVFVDRLTWLANGSIYILYIYNKLVLFSGFRSAEVNDEGTNVSILNATLFDWNLIAKVWAAFLTCSSWEMCVVVS